MAKKTARDLTINDLATAFGMSKSSIQRAIDSATFYTVKWAKKETAKGLGQILKLPYKTIRERQKTKTSVSISGGRGNIWFGLNALSLAYAQPIITGKGVSAAGQYYPEAFSVRSIGEIFERDGRRGIMSKGQYAGKIRERITKLKMPIDDRAMPYLIDFTQQAKAYFINSFIENLSNDFSRGTDKTRNQLVYDGATLELVSGLSPKMHGRDSLHN